MGNDNYENKITWKNPCTGEILVYKFCHKCGAQYIPENYIGSRINDPFYNMSEEHYTKCCFCGNELSDKPFTIDDEFDEVLVAQREKKELAVKNHGMEVFKASHPQTSSTAKSETSNTPKCPKCPTCGSTNVQPISSTRKLGGLLTFGLASKSVGKTYRCLNCKYYW